MDDLQEERRPLLDPLRARRYRSYNTEPEKAPQIEEESHHRSRTRSLKASVPQIIAITMVAIPLYLLASSYLILPGKRQFSRDPQYTPSVHPSIVSAIYDDFPDPALLHVNGTTYAYSTNSDRTHIQAAVSKDNTTFDFHKGDEILPFLAYWEWPYFGGVWAPDVVQISADPEMYLMYYASGTKQSKGQYHCIGAAVSPSPLGPFVPINDLHPLICPEIQSTGGAIDPDGFLDPSTGKRYIVYKVDGNALGRGGSCNNGIEPRRQTPLMLQEVDPSDGITMLGKPKQVLDRDQADGPLIEAPSLIRSEQGWYFLFYSSGCFTSPGYSVSYATSRDIWGPYVKSDRPLLATGDGAGGLEFSVVGPGGLDVVTGEVGVGNGDLVAFHGHIGPVNEGRGGGGIGGGGDRGKPDENPGPLRRGTYVARLRFDGRKAWLQ